MIGLHALRADVAERCRELATHGFALAGAGNVSMRSKDHVLITRAGMRFETAEADDVTVVTLAGDVVDGARPSSETGLHLGIYQRSVAGAVVHTHGRSSVAVGLVCDEMPLVHYNLLRLGGRIPTIPHLLFGSHELAKAVGTAVAGGHGTVLMRNHGAVSSARTWPRPSSTPASRNGSATSTWLPEASARRRCSPTATSPRWPSKAAGWPTVTDCGSARVLHSVHSQRAEGT